MIHTDGLVPRTSLDMGVRRGVTVNQVGGTIHEDSDAYEVTLSSLTRKVEAVPHTV